MTGRRRPRSLLVVLAVVAMIGSFIIFGLIVGKVASAIPLLVSHLADGDQLSPPSHRIKRAQAADLCRSVRLHEALGSVCCSKHLPDLGAIRVCCGRIATLLSTGAV
jgi:hypothetical protein